MAQTGFVSDDGKSFISVKEAEEQVDDNHDNGNEDGDLDVDLSKIPEEHRGVFEKLAKDLKDKSKMLDSLTNKNSADLADAIKGLKSTLDGSKSKTPEQLKAERKKLVDGIKFEDGDYYKKFFEPLIEAVNKLDERIDGLGGEVVKAKATSWQDRVVNFIEKEKLSKEVVSKMDELARSMGPGVYNDLSRLAKLAKMELGIDDKKVKKEDDDDDSRVSRKRRGSIEMSSSRKTNSAKKPIKSMTEAWDAAEEQLGEEE